MSASRDGSQRFKFIYSLKPETQARLNKDGSQVVQVLKTGEKPAIEIKPYSPTEFLRNRIEKRPEKKGIEIQSRAKNPALDSLKKNIQDLDQLQSKLQFILRELEDLTKD